MFIEVTGIKNDKILINLNQVNSIQLIEVSGSLTVYFINGDILDLDIKFYQEIKESIVKNKHEYY